MLFDIILMWRLYCHTSQAYIVNVADLVRGKSSQNLRTRICDTCLLRACTETSCRKAKTRGLRICEFLLKCPDSILAIVWDLKVKLII